MSRCMKQLCGFFFLPRCKHEKRNCATGRLCMQISVPELNHHICSTAVLHFLGSSCSVWEARYGDETNTHIWKHDWKSSGMSLLICELSHRCYGHPQTPGRFYRTILGVPSEQWCHLDFCVSEDPEVHFQVCFKASEISWSCLLSSKHTVSADNWLTVEGQLLWKSWKAHSSLRLALTWGLLKSYRAIP